MGPDSTHTPLGELVSLVTDRALTAKDPKRPYVGLEHMSGGSAELAGYAPSSQSISTNTIFQKGDVLFGKLRPNLRKSVIAPFDGYCSTDILVLRPSAEVKARFAGHLFQSDRVFAAATRTAIGTRMPRTSWHSLRELLVFRPAPSEQQQIAEVLDTIDSAIRQTDALIVKLQSIYQGLLCDLLTKGVDEHSDLRDPHEHPDQFRDTILGPLPSQWEIQEFRTLCESSAFGPRFSGDLYADDGELATLRTTDMDDQGNLSLSTMPRARISPLSMANHLIKQDDLLVSRSGTCGIAAVFPGYDRPVVPGAFLIRFRLHERLQAHFYRRYFNSPIGRSRLDRMAVGGVQKNLKGSEILAMPVPICPLDEAQRILDIIHASNGAIDGERAELHKMLLVKQGLAKDLLTGRALLTALSEAVPS